MQLSAADDEEWWTDKRIIIIINERHATFPSNICFKCLSCMRPSRGSVPSHWALEACSDEHTTRHTQSSPLRFIVLSWTVIQRTAKQKKTGYTGWRWPHWGTTITAVCTAIFVSPNCDNYCSKTTDSTEKRAAEETCRKSSALRVNSRPDDWSLVGHGVQEINKYLMRKWLDKRCSLVAG